MRTSARSGAWLLWLAVLFVAAPARAGGLYIQEFGTPSSAMAGGGAGALALDASAAFHNAAGMTRLDDHQALGSLGVLVGDFKFETSPDTPFPDGNGGQQGNPAPVLGGHYVHRVWDRDNADYLDRVRFGVSLVSISGAVLDPKNDWAGRFEVQELSLITLSAIPTVALRVHPKLSVAAGANMMYGSMKYKLAVPLPPLPFAPSEAQIKFDDIDDFEAGAVVGVLFELDEKTRLGVTWMQEVELDLTGDVKLSNPNISASTDVRVPFAQAVRVGLVRELTPAFLLGASFRWEDWSTFENQFVRVAGFTGNLNRNWKDTYGFSLGGRYELSESWRLLGGVAWDSSPVTSSFRTADLPVDHQFRLGMGVQRTLSPDTTLGLNFNYAYLGESQINSETLDGQFKRNQLFSFALYFAFQRLPWSSRD